MAEQPWIVEREPESAGALRKAGFSRVLAALLSQRGLENQEAAERFLSCGEPLHDPMRLKGMEAAAARVAQAVRNGERIVVYGDYDADGVTSTALLTGYLREAGAAAEYYVPDRESEGYGLNPEAAEKLAAGGAQVVVTVDTGISAFGEARLLAQRGVCLIVTDHHEPRRASPEASPEAAGPKGEDAGASAPAAAAAVVALPEAFAVVNPKQPGCAYPCKELAGVGVAFKLVCAVEAQGHFLGLSAKRLFTKYGGLVCLGTVADVVPLTGENRTLVSGGLTLLEAGASCGLSALLEAAGSRGRKLTATALAFTAAPRLNACGRVSSARDAVDLLLETEPVKAVELAQKLNENNILRRETEAAIAREAQEKIDGTEALRLAPLLIVSGEGWHNGVIGIVASRLVERYGKPAVVVSFEDGVGRASCRSLPGFNIHAALSSCASLLERFGGHELAAGFTVRRENYDALYQALQRQALALPEPPALRVRADLALSGGEVSLSTARDVRRLEPFGSGNPAPLFLIPAAQILEARPVGKGHLRLLLRCGGYEFPAILFGAQERGFPFRENDLVDFAAELTVSLYRNAESLSVVIRQFRKSACFENSRRLFEAFLGGAEIDAARAPELIPARAEFAAVYRLFRAAPDGGLSLEESCKSLCRANPHFNYFKLLLITEIFVREGLFDVRRSPDSDRAEPVPKPLPPGAKIDLEASPLLRRLRPAPGQDADRLAPEAGRGAESGNR